VIYEVMSLMVLKGPLVKAIDAVDSQP